MDIVVDFDGTCTTHAFPNIGKDIGAVPVLLSLVKGGHNLIIFTMRSDNVKNPTGGELGSPSGLYLTEAVNWFNKNEIPVYGIQKNPTQHTWTSSPKAYGQLIIDDAALGCPLKMDLSISNRPFVDWDKVRSMLIEMGVISQ